MINYRTINKEDHLELAEYHRMRHTLWRNHEVQELYEEMLKILEGREFFKDELSWTTFVAARENRGLAGFIEITQYPELDFCDSKPVGFIEGWYVDEDMRKAGVGKALVDTAVHWLLSRGCTEIASDVEEGNLISQAAHLRLGFKEMKRMDGCVFYKRPIAEDFEYEK